MNKDIILDEIIEYLKSRYLVHTIILYGSRARDEATNTNDYDIVALCEQSEFIRDCKIFKGLYLDAFIYPESKFPYEDDYI